MVRLFTGGGKTVIAGEESRLHNRTLFLAHMDTLVSQAHASLERTTGKRWAIEQADLRANPTGPLSVVASVMTMTRDERLKRFAPDAFDLIVCDEAHHALARSWVKILRHFPAAKRLLISATPDRKDEAGYRGIADHVAFDMGLADAIAQAWATPVEIATYRSHINLDGVAWSKGDFQVGALDQQIAKSVAPIVRAALTLAGDLRTVIFTPGVQSAHVVAEALNAVRPGCARAIDGSMSKDDKRKAIADHKAGRYQFLTNCLMLTEGYDDEKLGCIIDAAPTASRARCEQKFGRGTRLYPGIGDIPGGEHRRAAISGSPKPFVRIVDLAFNSSKHSLAGPVEVLGAAYTDKERAHAQRALATVGGDPLALLEKAREELARRAARAAAARQAKVALERTSKDPEEKIVGERALTPGQQNILRYYGIPWTPETTKSEASRLISTEKIARLRGLCTWAQRDWLKRNVGIDGRAMYSTTARRLADAWKANGRFLSKAEVYQIVKGQ